MPPSAPTAYNLPPTTSPLPRITWSLLLILFMGAALSTTGASVGIISLSLLVVAILVAWNFPYIAFYISLALAPLIGIIISISTGNLSFGERAFGGSIDVGLSEVVASIVVLVWALRMLLLWRGRQDRHWQPWLPLLVPYMLLVGAHLLSVFSPALPDPLVVIKYTLRPVFLAYLFYVVLPANFLKSKRRLIAAMTVLVCVGVFFAADGLRSLVTFQEGELPHLTRAHPLAILGVLPLGDNHNLLAEFLLFTAPLALALSKFARSSDEKKLALWSALFMFGITLLTFARSAWIAFICEMLLLAATIWRPWIKAHARQVLIGIVAFLPLFAYMIYFSSTAEVQSSTDARKMLTDIGLFFFEQSPIIGVGAGTWVDRVGKTWMFSFEFGAPLDSHGVLQKLAAETGLVGLAAFALVVFAIFRYAWECLQTLRHREAERAIMLYLTAATMGAFIYQIFNTTYWTAKLWLPVGILFAAGKILTDRANAHEPDFLRGLD